MSQDLVKIETNTAVAANDLLSNFSIKPSTIKLWQQSNDEVDGLVIKPGQFFDELDNSVFDSIVAVPLSIGYGRGYYPGKYVAGNKSTPVCRSFDNGPGAKPLLAQSPAPQATSCSACKHSKWTVVNGSKTPPDCKESYKMLFLDPTGLPKVFYFKGMGVQPLKKFGELLKARTIQARNTGKGDFTLIDYQVTLGSVKIGKFYAPSLTKLELHGKDFTKEYKEYVSRFNDASAEAEFEEELDQTLENTFQEV